MAKYRVEARAEDADDWELVEAHRRMQAAYEAAAALIREPPYTEARVMHQGRQIGVWRSYGPEALAPGVTVEQLAEKLRRLTDGADTSP